MDTIYHSFGYNNIGTTGSGVQDSVTGHEEATMGDALPPVNLGAVSLYTLCLCVCVCVCIYIYIYICIYIYTYTHTNTHKLQWGMHCLQ